MESRAAAESGTPKPRYILTYGIETTELGSNILEHAFLGLSFWSGTIGERIEVTNSWGFYAQKSKDDGSSLIRHFLKFPGEKFKLNIGLAVDPTPAQQAKTAMINK